MYKISRAFLALLGLSLLRWSRVLGGRRHAFYKGQFTLLHKWGRTRRRCSAEVECRRLEDRGAEDAEGVGCGEGVPPPHSAVPAPQKIFDFGSQCGEFWCILDGIFLQFSYLFYMQN